MAADSGDDGGEPDRIVVVTQDGMGVAAAAGSPDDERVERNPAELVEQPAKVMRIGSMVKQLLEEVRSAPLDEAGRSRLAAIHERSLHELEQGLAPELVDELRRITLPFGDGQTPSDAELRIAQAQLVGWLEGLFHGIQTALWPSRWPPRRSWRRCAGPCRRGPSRRRGCTSRRTPARRSTRVRAPASTSTPRSVSQPQPPLSRGPSVRSPGCPGLSLRDRCQPGSAYPRGPPTRCCTGCPPPRDHVRNPRAREVAVLGAG